MSPSFLHPEQVLFHGATRFHHHVSIVDRSGQRTWKPDTILCIDTKNSIMKVHYTVKITYSCASVMTHCLHSTNFSIHRKNENIPNNKNCPQEVALLFAVLLKFFLSIWLMLIDIELLTIYSTSIEYTFNHKGDIMRYTTMKKATNLQQIKTNI